MKKKILLTGGKGILGRHFIAKNQDKYFFTAPSREELELKDTQQVDQFFRNQNFDTIIHGANVGGTRKSSGDDWDYFAENIRTFENIFKNRAKAAKFIQLGSGAEYGRPLSKKEIREELLEENVPNDSYGLSKLICSQILKRDPPTKSVTLHIFGLFAPNEDYQIRFISNAIVRALHGLPIIILQNIRFEYVFVDDFIKILEKFVENDPKYSNYNIGTGRPVFLTQIAEKIRQILGNNIEIQVKKEAPDYEYTCSNERLTEFLGSKFKFTPLKLSITKMIEFYTSRMNELNLSWIENPI